MTSHSATTEEEASCHAVEERPSQTSRQLQEDLVRRAAVAVTDPLFGAEQREAVWNLMKEKEAGATAAAEAGFLTMKKRHDTFRKCCLQLSEEVRKMKAANDDANLTLECARKNAAKEYRELIDEFNSRSSEILSLVARKEFVEQKRNKLKEEVEALGRQSTALKEQCDKVHKTLSDKRGRLSQLLNRISSSEHEEQRARERCALAAEAEEREHARLTSVLSRIDELRQQRTCLNRRLWEVIQDMQLHRDAVLRYENRCGMHIVADSVPPDASPDVRYAV